MHVRVSSVTRNGKTYAYTQLVESYRRADGMPAHRVVANLGQLSSAQVDNLKTALAAGRVGEHVAVTPAPASSSRPPRRPQANLQYLDLVVLLELWREWGLHRLLDDLLPRGEADVCPADVVAALVLQRCAAPGSTLHAERWFPRTSLPELLAIDPSSFNNTRLHRVLDELDAVTPSLMSRLPTLYLEHLRRPSFVTLYLDVSDAAFVGHGPSLAVRGKTKEGLILRKIGIVLLCNERGYPLRWRVVAGNAADSVVMTDMFQAVADTRWAQQTPVVCDRAMGKTAVLRTMNATGLHFLTAMTVSEFDTYAPQLPYETFSALRAPAEGDAPAYATAVEQACRQAEAVGLTRIADTLWVVDLGVVKLDVPSEQDIAAPPPRAATSVAHALDLCRKIEQAVVEGRFASFNAAGRAHGLTKAMTKKYRLLGRLPQDVQEAILRGEADRCTLERLAPIAKLSDPTQQRARFAALVEASAARTLRRPIASPEEAQAAPAAAPTRATEAPLRVRVVAYFNPERFVDQRLDAERRKTAIATFVRELNERLARPRSRLDHVKILAAVDRRLRRDDLIEMYRVSVTEQHAADRVFYRAEVDLVHAEWKQRHRYHGFTVLVAHEKITQPAADLCRLYRAKDQVEKDFQTIKSITKLRPIRHHSDAKVSAHVTLCMLALLLERRLEHKLDGHCSAQNALETLATCHLNQYRGTGSSSLYTVTEADPDQVALLRKLRMPLVVDEGDVTARITPRLCLRKMPDPAEIEP
jgi:hypothetical protein